MARLAYTGTNAADGCEIAFGAGSSPGNKGAQGKAVAGVQEVIDVDADSNAGKHDKFIAEFARCSRQVYCYIRSLVPNRSDADDVYQAASLVMWRKFADFTPGTNFFTWGCQIAFFEIKKLRDAGKRSHHFSDEALAALNAEFGSRIDDAPSRLSALSDCLEKLAPESRWLIERKYFQERSAEELSREMNCSMASVYRGLARVHTWLLACIQQTLSGGI